MRKIGEVPNPNLGERLSRFLASQGIESQVEGRDGTIEVWILQEERVAEAKGLLGEFLADPEAERFTAAVPRQGRPGPGRSRPSPSRSFRAPRPVGEGTPLTWTLIFVCAAVAFLTNFGKQHLELLEPLWFTDAWRTSGEIWRIFTPAIVHLGMMHLVFNMYWLLALGGTIERIKGTLGLAGLIVAVAAASHLSQAILETPQFGGMSGVVYGLFGFIWMRSSLLPWEGFYMPRDTVIVMVGWALLCLTGAVGPVANTAHFAGLFAGMILGAWPKLRSRMS